MSRIGAFIIGVAVALAAPAAADRIETACGPVIVKSPPCTPQALGYNRASLWCHVA